jgi:hypothetical protein
MAELQTSYSNTIAKGYAGMVANGETSNRITRTCEDAAGIGFGVPVYRGSGDHGCTGHGRHARDLPRLGRSQWRDSGWCRGRRRHLSLSTTTSAFSPSGAIYVAVKGAVERTAMRSPSARAAALRTFIGATAADATHIATGFIADETVTDGICRIVKR